MSKHPKKRKVKVLKVQKVDPDKHLVELEVEGAEDVPEVPLPAEPLVLDELQPEHHGWLTWLKGLF